MTLIELTSDDLLDALGLIAAALVVTVVAIWLLVILATRDKERR